MKVAVLILAHKDSDHLKRLVDSMSHDSVDFFIHIDKKNVTREFPTIKKELKAPNIHFVSSQKVFWASISQTEARLKLIKAATNCGAYSHLIMISGQCYPIQPINSILKKLSENKEVSFIEHHLLPYDKLGVNSGLDRIKCYSYTIFGKKITYFSKEMKTTFNNKGKLINAFLGFYHMFVKKRKHPENVKPYYGIDWWIITGEAAKYILNFVNKNPYFHKYHKYTRHTSEVYFPSILAGTNYNGKLINKSIHYMQWSKINSAHPIVLSESEFDEILTSEAYFARKFETLKSAYLLRLIDDKILDNG